MLPVEKRIGIPNPLRPVVESVVRIWARCGLSGSVRDMKDQELLMIMAGLAGG